MNILKISFNKFVQIIEMLIIVRMFLSFITRDLNNPIVSFIYQVTEPILSPFRGLINKLNINTGMLDFSPLFAVLFLNFISFVLDAFIW
ncbi:YggT family protein [Brassicibacter mesophilus]|uniref:YggT family protein n=1 Tax=Brassicibacter mesophilus TaxID=745119 RepID=UPI003D1BD8F9